MDKICKKCNIIVKETYCGNCGNTIPIKRIDKKYATEVIVKMMSFEKGITYTTKMLLTQPAVLINEYLYKDRQLITKPITYLLFTSVIYIFISKLFFMNEVYIEIEASGVNNSSFQVINKWIQNNMGYANLITIIPMTLINKLFFYRSNYNIFETFVVLAFVLGSSMLIFSLNTIFDTLLTEYKDINSIIFNIIILIYSVWAIGQFYGNNFVSYLKSFLSLITGYFAIVISITMLSIIYDILQSI